MAKASEYDCSFYTQSKRSVILFVYSTLELTISKCKILEVMLGVFADLSNIW
ncbi:GSCOCG00008244001-RA-CDS [Cotesia congregata]|nr:GSCOCG00008244001-RA-CDS [Cotesia congregata]